MFVLVACEESQVVCSAFRSLGHIAFSCDIKPCSGGHPEWHIFGDCLPLLNGRCSFTTSDGVFHTLSDRWDLIIAHPPCTYLSNAGNAHLNQPGRKDKRLQAADFFMQFVNADCDRICIENPPGYMNSHYRPADQQVHPYFFSHSVGDENYQFKRTNFWLFGLSPLFYNVSVPAPEPVYFTSRPDGTLKKRYFVDSCSGSDRAAMRSVTFPGIAFAMASQWGSNVQLFFDDIIKDP